MVMMMMMLLMRMVMMMRTIPAKLLGRGPRGDAGATSDVTHFMMIITLMMMMVVMMMRTLMRMAVMMLILMVTMMLIFRSHVFAYISAPEISSGWRPCPLRRC